MSPNQIERVRRKEEFKANQRRQRANQIETMIVGLERMCADLKLQIQAEEMRTGVWTELGALKSEMNEHAMQKPLRAVPDFAVASLVV